MLTRIFMCRQLYVWTVQDNKIVIPKMIFSSYSFSLTLYCKYTYRHRYILIYQDIHTLFNIIPCLIERDIKEVTYNMTSLFKCRKLWCFDKISPTFKVENYYAYIISCNIITITIKRSNTTSTHDKLLQRNDALSIFKSRYFWGCKDNLMDKNEFYQ